MEDFFRIDSVEIMKCFSEFFGTFILVLLGDGVITNVSLEKSKAKDGGWLAIALGWGFAVTIAVYCAGFMGPAHLNPAVTLGFAMIGEFEWSLVIPFIISQLLGAFCAAVVIWWNFMPHWKETKDEKTILGSFVTIPAIRNKKANFLSEAIGTFVLVFGLLALTRNQFSDGLKALIVGMIVGALVLSLGGTTGYALNPARDLGPRIAHQILPIANKGDSDWDYAWVPVLGPITGGILGALFFTLFP